MNLLISPVTTNIKRKKNKNINIGFKIGNLKNNKTMDNIDNFIKKFKKNIINSLIIFFCNDPFMRIPKNNF